MLAQSAREWPVFIFGACEHAIEMVRRKLDVAEI
jgi:hypothetical protein